MGNKTGKVPKKITIKKNAFADNDGKNRKKFFFLLKFSAPVNRMEMLRTWDSLEHVSHCDATKGDFDLVVTFQAHDLSALRGIADRETKNPAQTRNAVFLEVISSPWTKTINLTGCASSYVFLETEKEKAEGICSTLKGNGNVVSCDLVEGKFNMVLQMAGASFPEIDRSIQTRIKPLEGVLRIKETPVIQLFEK